MLTQSILVPYPQLSPGKYTLRVTLQPANNAGLVVSPSTVVKYVDQNWYWGTTRIAYNAIKEWRPGVTVKTQGLPGNVISQADYPKH